jgi:hypothetical protein
MKVDFRQKLTWYYMVLNTIFEANIIMIINEPQLQ